MGKQRDREEDYQRIKEDYESEGIVATDDMVEEKYDKEKREERKRGSK